MIKALEITRNGKGFEHTTLNITFLNHCKLDCKKQKEVDAKITYFLEKLLMLKLYSVDHWNLLSTKLITS